MATGTPFTPALFTTTQVAPAQPSIRRSLPYLSPGDYRFAPTAVGTKQLVSGSSSPASDSTASLALVLARASSWVDEICFHRSKGSFQANVVVESGYFVIKPNGGFDLICNFKPVLEVTGLAVGSSPAAIANVSASVAPNLWIEGKIVHVPATWGNTPQPLYGYPVDLSNSCYVVWSYVSGYPNFQLNGSPAAGATSLTLKPPFAGGTTLPGIYAGTPLNISDGASSETVLASATPTGLSVGLQAATVFTHTSPAAPDFIRVTALPSSIEQATIHLASVLLKTQGTRAMTMAATPGGTPSHQTMALSGAMDDFSQACRLLKPHEVVYLHD